MLLRESAVELGPGSVLDRRFQIRRVLGKGATGVVLEADDRVSRSLVALKVFKPEIASDDRWQEILGSELRHARQIMHPNVCRVFDAGEADGYRFLSMEYASGGSLRQRLKDAAADRPFEERVADARAVVDGLAAIHAAGLIHRDVKPDNVLRMEDGRLVLTDFGLAVAPGQSTFVSGYSGAVGTPSYMAPEVAMGGDASMASDVFSLGVILHEIFFGRRPEWDTTKRGRFLRAPVDRHTPRRLRQMARLCAECLDHLAPRRPQTAMEVARQFERAVAGRYGTFLGALRTGKWGLVAGFVLAGLGAWVVIFVTRPSEDVSRPKLMGVGTDWSNQAKVVSRRAAPMRCLSTSPDGKIARVIWDEPSEAVEIDAESGQGRPWPILPETFADGRCPAPSPDGRRLAFTAGIANPQIMLSPNPDGSGARPLTAGYRPQWHPRGQELVYSFDGRRVGVVGVHGSPALLPETAEMDELLMSVAISNDGNRLAVVHRRPQASLVSLHDFPSLRLVRKFRLEMPVANALFSVPEGRLLVSVNRGGASEVIELQSDDVMARHAQMGSFLIGRLAPSSAGLWLATDRRWATLFLKQADGTRRELAKSGDFYGMSADASGNLVVQENLPGGGSVIGLYDANLGRYRRLTAGQRDFEPLIQPGRRAVAYLDLAADRIRLCDFDGPLRCRSLAEGQKTRFMAGFSPSGQRLAFFSLAGSRARLRVISMADNAITDLGLRSSRRCPVRWTDENRLWMFWPEQSEWSEFDVTAGTTTGRTEPVASPTDRCPEIAGPDPALPFEAVSEKQSVLWFRPR
jgi:hypothetical protein